MRYWIWWNDLIQGPFEFDELVLLRAFSEDLLVCMEDRTDWLPASRVADLSSAIEQLRSRRAAPTAPPPPPPSRPSTVTPLQGEFFGEPPEQQTLIDTDEGPKGPFAYRPVTIESESPYPYFVGRATMPIYFIQPRQSATAVIEMPVSPPPRVIHTPIPVVNESAVREPVEEPRPPVPLRLLEEELPVKELPVPSAMLNLSYEEPSRHWRDLQWLPWALGILVSLGLLGSGAYWMIDRANTRSAIVEAKRLESPVKDSYPIRPPDSATPVFQKISPAVHRTSRSVIKAVRKRMPHRAAKPAPPPPPVVPELPGVEAVAPKPVAPPPPEAAAAADLWSGKQNDAINLVIGKMIPGGKVTIGNHARDMLQDMHEKELIHAAETGERLYLPDKISWAALREEGPRYRVYLNFLSMQASGERVQARSYQFLVSLDRKTVESDDASTQQDMLTPPSGPAFKHNPMAVDIESILGGVDSYNKQEMRAIIVKKNRRNKKEQANILSNLATSKDKVIRATVFFRRTYSDKAMANIAKAYGFTDLLKG